MKESNKIMAGWFPEVGAGGFTSLDGTIEFYTRINALLTPDMTVLDFGGGARRRANGRQVYLQEAADDLTG